MSEAMVSPPQPSPVEDDKESWNLASIVASLRGIRDRSHLAWRHPHSLVQMPSRKALGQALEGLSASLYPHRLGQPEPDLFGFPTPLSATDYFVGHTLDASLRSLRDQIRIELAACEPPRSREQQTRDLEHRATSIVADFADQLPSILAILDTDLQAAFTGDPAAGSIDEVLVCYPGVKAITYHRFAHALYSLGSPVIARIIAEISHSSTGVDIHPGAKIGESFFIDHGSGVVIGGTAVIGKRVRLYQAVTLGSKHFPVDDHGHLVKGKPRHPIVEDDVVIYAGATILGRVTIGKGSTIGGNVWLTRSIPAGTTITQALARNETFNEGAGI